MIEVNAVENGIKVAIKGSLTDLVAETSQIIYAIYEGMDENSHSSAEQYRDFIINHIEGIFEVGDDMRNKSRNRDKSSEHNDTLKSFDEFLDDLSDLLNELKSKNNKEEN